MPSTIQVKMTPPSAKKNGAKNGRQQKLLAALEHLDVHSHQCLMYESKKEQFDAVIPFMQIGLQRGEKCVYIADDNTTQEVLDAMKAYGIDVKGALKSGALSVITKRDSYLKNGYFDPDEMIAFLTSETKKAKKEGFKALRVTGEMTWMLGGEPGTDRLLEYEAKLNTFLPSFDALAICQYNKKRFSPEILLGVIQTHPTVIIGNTVCHNFYYVPPEEFLLTRGRKTEVDRMLRNLVEREQLGEVEEKMLESEEMFAIAFNASPNLMAITKMDGTLVNVNAAFTRLLGYASEEAVGKTTAALKIWVRPEDRDTFIAGLTKKGVVRDFETTLRKKDGSVITVIDNAKLIDLHGARHVLSIIYDISERKNVESTLRQSSAYARGLIEASIDPLVTISSNGKITDVNHATELVTGVARGKLIGTDFSNYFTEPDKAKKGYKEVFKNGVVRDYPLAIRHLNGKITDVLYNATVYKDEAGKVQGVFAAARDVTERKRIEAEREQFFKFFNISPDIMVIADPLGAFKRVNPATRAILGYSESELIAKPFNSFIHEDDKKRTDEEMAHQMKNGSSLNFENRYICKDKSYRWLSWRAIYDKTEGITYATARDITERRKLEEEIRRRNRALSVMSEGNRILVHASTEQEMFERMCQNFIEHGGYRLAWIGLAEQDERKTVRVVASAGYDEGYTKKVDVVWSVGTRGQGPTGTSIRTKKTIVARDITTQPKFEPWRKDALERGYASSIALPLHYNGDTYGAVTLYASEPDAFQNEELKLLEELSGDISYGISVLRLRKKSSEVESLLKKEAEEISDLYHNAPCGYHSLDENGAYVRVNETELRWLGYPREELLGKKFSDLLTPEGIETFKRAFPKFKIDGHMVEIGYDIRRKDGTLLPISISATAIRDAKGKYLMSRGMMFDVSERRKAEERIKESNHLKNEFIKIVSHQLRTPLSVIRWNLDSVLNRKRGLVPPAQEEALRSSYSANVEVITRIGDLVTALDIEESRVFLEKDRVDLSELFRSTCEEKLRACEPKRITYEIHEPQSPLPVAEIDPAKIRDVVERLVDNAVIYTPEGGRIDVWYERTDGNMRFKITDTGIGIPKSEQPRIFERFHRGWNAAQMKQDASGLGLFISKHYIEEHGGTISFTSKERQGSTFWFEIPISES